MTEHQPIVERDSEGWSELPATWPDCLRRVMAARGIKTESDFVYDLASLPAPEQLSGMDEAVKLMAEAIKQQWHIVIVADFDTDGATSCALAVRALSAMGADKVSYLVPNRFKHGYGLSRELLNDADLSTVDLIMTVDNGIASIDGVAAAHEQDIKVVITDHHLPAEVLPDADAIVNPNLKDDSFPSKKLAGVGVCFYLLLGLRRELRQQDWFQQKMIPEPNLMQWLDLVAVGTVADLVPLDRLNRTLVNIGLQRIRAGKTIEGIDALITVAGRERTSLSANDIGFALAPRINAAGRLQDMRQGITLLLCDDPVMAQEQAWQLNTINSERRQVEQDMRDDAIAMLANMSFSDEQPMAYCLYDDSWHQGVIGLVASRIKEQQHRPVIAFAPSSNGEIKGSARSIQGIHIRDALARVASEAPSILQHFGGHAMAAGLTINRHDLADFEALFINAVTELADPAMFTQTLYSDGELADKEMTLSLAEQLSIAAPWGQGFVEPQFHGQFKILAMRALGEKSNHLKLNVALPNGREVTAMAFGQFAPDWLDIGQTIILRYRLSVNNFRQQRQLQLLVDNLLPT